MNDLESLFFRVSFSSNCLCIGERVKKGTFRPCLDVLPCSTVMGMLINSLGWAAESSEEPFPICAVGGPMTGIRETLTFAPGDLGVGTSKIPLTIEFLSHVTGEFFLKKTQSVPDLETLKSKIGTTFRMGAFKSKGFGVCELLHCEEGEATLIEEEGTLVSRLYSDPEFLSAFGIQKVTKPRYGYLFRKTSMDEGYYQKAIFQGSRILGGYDFLMEEYNGRTQKNSVGS